MVLKADAMNKLAALAKLAPESMMTTAFHNKFERAIDLVDQISNIDVSGIEPMAHPLDLSQPLRDDRVSEQDQRDALLKLAPQQASHLFIVPKVID